MAEPETKKIKLVQKITSYAVISHKGGVGKSTITTNFAEMLNERGDEVVVVMDFDDQMTTSQILTGKHYKREEFKLLRSEYNMSDGFQRVKGVLDKSFITSYIALGTREKIELKDLVHIKDNKMYLLHGSPITEKNAVQYCFGDGAMSELYFPGLRFLVCFLKTRFEEIAALFPGKNVTFICDFPPSLSHLYQCFMRCCDYLVIVLGLDKGSEQGLDGLLFNLGNMQPDKRFTHHPVINSLIVNRVPDNKKEHAFDLFKTVMEFLDEHPKFNPCDGDIEFAVIPEIEGLDHFNDQRIKTLLQEVNKK